MKVSAFTRYTRQAASTRQRLLQYLPALREAGIEVEHHALLDDDYVQSLAEGEPYPARRVATAYWRRLHQLITSRRSDVVWVYVELFPFLPAPFERLATVGKPVIYDMDDAFFHNYDDSSNPLVRTLLGGKQGTLLAKAAACTCGNPYLRDYAARYCSDSVILPTVVDTDAYRPVGRRPERSTVIGWIGSPSTWPNVRPLLPLLRELCSKSDLRFRVVGAGRAAEADRFPGMDLVPWTEATEIAEVQAMDIGIMPLIDRPFERGKSGYKLIQYMACGLPVVASPVGVNADIIIPGQNGLFATSEMKWRLALGSLIADPDLRARLGAAGRQRAVADYSLARHAPRLVELLRRSAALR